MEDAKGAELRAALRRFMRRHRPRPLKTAPWAEKAGIAESTLRNFLKGGKSLSLTYTTLKKLADAEGVPVAVLTGEMPEWSAEQRRAAEIAGRLPPDDLPTWLRWGAGMAEKESPAFESEPPRPAAHRKTITDGNG